MLFALGFVFMFTIGGLIIHLALPLKITICREVLTIILLEFYLNSVKMYNFEQSAGNQQVLSTLVGSSETTRDPCGVIVILAAGRDSPLNKNSLIYLSFYNSPLYKNNNFIIRHYSTSSSFINDDITFKSLVFPLPVRPITARVVPASIRKFISFKVASDAFL